MNHREREQLLVLLDERMAAVEKSYVAQAGGQSVCQLHKDGRGTGGLKYDEGQLVALRTIRREMSRAVNMEETLVAMQERWRKEIEIHEERNRPQPWIAYSQGGLDAVIEALKVLDHD